MLSLVIKVSMILDDILTKREIKTTGGPTRLLLNLLTGLMVIFKMLKKEFQLLGISNEKDKNGNSQEP
jgi:hypothetical protein